MEFKTGDEVEVFFEGKWVSGYRYCYKDDDGGYKVLTTNSWNDPYPFLYTYKEIRKAPKVTFIPKSPQEILKWLLDEGWVYDPHDNAFRSYIQREREVSIFFLNALKNASIGSLGDWKWRDEWLLKVKRYE